jgi:hypothetical protein
MYNDRLAMEHYRIHVMELWPDGPKKEAGLASARSALERITTATSSGSSFACTACASRRTVTVIRSDPRVHKLPSGLAA